LQQQKLSFLETNAPPLSTSPAPSTDEILSSNNKIEIEPLMFQYLLREASKSAGILQNGNQSCGGGAGMTNASDHASSLLNEQLYKAVVDDFLQRKSNLFMNNQENVLSPSSLFSVPSVTPPPSCSTSFSSLLSFSSAAALPSPRLSHGVGCLPGGVVLQPL
jgi:hypothetical protein